LIPGPPEYEARTLSTPPRCLFHGVAFSYFYLLSYSYYWQWRPRWGTWPLDLFVGSHHLGYPPCNRYHPISCPTTVPFHGSVSIAESYCKIPMPLKLRIKFCSFYFPDIIYMALVYCSFIYNVLFKIKLYVRVPLPQNF
jgi:hypothetical protein